LEKTTYFTIGISMSGPAPAHLNYQDHKNELYLSANGALSGPKQCQLDSKELAEKFLEAYMPRLQKRYGADVRAEVFKGEAICSGALSEKRVRARIETDSRIARKRLEKGLLAPNARLFD
jgi:hypothetical protein